MTLVPNDLPAADLISQIAILGAAINRHVAGGLSDAGYAELRPGHGYVVQRLLTGPQQITAMAADLGISQQAVSKNVRDLVRLGFSASPSTTVTAGAARSPSPSADGPPSSGPGRSGPTSSGTSARRSVRPTWPPPGP